MFSALADEDESNSDSDGEKREVKASQRPSDCGDEDDNDIKPQRGPQPKKAAAAPSQKVQQAPPKKGVKPKVKDSVELQRARDAANRASGPFSRSSYLSRTLPGQELMTH